MKFDTGFYQPSQAFLAIAEHTAVMDARTQALIAVTGPSHDAESAAYARLFAAAPQLLEAAHFALKVLRENQPVELSEFLAIATLTKAIKAAAEPAKLIAEARK